MVLKEKNDEKQLQWIKDGHQIIAKAQTTPLDIKKKQSEKLYIYITCKLLANKAKNYSLGINTKNNINIASPYKQS